MKGNPDLTALTAPIRARVEAATEGPWDVKECSPCTARGRLDVSIWAHDGNVSIADWCDEDEFTQADAEFIAAARTDVPRLLQALDGVLAGHQPHSVPYSNDKYCNACRGDVGQRVKHPCATVRAVVAALGEGK